MKYCFLGSKTKYTNNTCDIQSQINSYSGPLRVQFRTCGSGNSGIFEVGIRTYVCGLDNWQVKTGYRRGVLENTSLYKVSYNDLGKSVIRCF